VLALDLAPAHLLELEVLELAQRALHALLDLLGVLGARRGSIGLCGIDGAASCGSGIRTRTCDRVDAVLKAGR
jgi:hypothetical protein